MFQSSVVGRRSKVGAVALTDDRRLATALVNIAIELALDRARILALRDRDNALDDHFPDLGLNMNGILELAGKGQKKKIRHAHAVDGGDKRHGDSGTELARIGKVIHLVDQPHDRTDDADGRTVATQAVIDLGGGSVVVLLGGNVYLENLADRIRLGAVHKQLQAFAGKFIRLPLA